MSEIVRRSSRRARNPVDYNPRGPRIMPYGNSTRTQYLRRQRARQQAQAQQVAAIADRPFEIDENAPLSLVCKVNIFLKFFFIFTY